MLHWSGVYDEENLKRVRVIIPVYFATLPGT